MRVFAVILTLAMSSGWASAAAPTAKQLIKAYTAADETCRGSQGDTGAAECERRSRLSARLSQIGWCYGKKSQDRSEFK